MRDRPPRHTWHRYIDEYAELCSELPEKIHIFLGIQLRSSNKWAYRCILDCADGVSAVDKIGYKQWLPISFSALKSANEPCALCSSAAFSNNLSKVA